ncbi:MAG: alkaline phosphatase family protein [Myxococcaceae bacterium]|nr:alkaline phosphatase family protein [Myxococcaceae bacterium]
MGRGLAVTVSLVAGLCAAQERPRLGVMVVVDQLSLDAFDRRLPLARGGFKRLVAEGFRFGEMRYEAAATLTAAGHSTLATGAYASTHGIVANEWIDPETGRPRLAVEDPAYQVLGRAPARQDGTAPTSLRVPTLGDSVKVSAPGARVVAVSAKDRSAILMGGRSADAAVWFDAERPLFTSSTFYGPKLPAWVQPTNLAVAEALVQRRFAWGLPGGGLTGKHPPPASARNGDSEPNAEQAALQPLLDRWEVDLALAAVDALALGADEVPDLLTVSFSGHDRIGHEFGPDSPEGLAEFLAVDVQLGRLLEGLDAKVGKGRYVLVLSSDHGVCPVPELSKQRGLDAGRVDLKALRERLEAEADAALGPLDYFAGSKTPGLTATSKGRAKLLSIASRLRAVALEQPGVLDLVAAPALLEPSALGAAGALWRRGYFPGRSPDFLVIAKPYWSYGTADVTGHASHWLYDRQVPLVFFGAGVPRGAAPYAEAIDVAPTFARLLGVPAPAGAEGRVLEALFR